MGSISDTAFPNPSIAYPQDCLQQVELCRFPKLTDGISPSQYEWREQAFKIHKSEAELSAFCTLYNVTKAAVLQAAWAVALGKYVGTDKVGFSCVMTSEHDIKALVCRPRLASSKTVCEVISDLQATLDQDLPNIPSGCTSFAGIGKLLGSIMEQWMHNSIMCIQMLGDGGMGSNPLLSRDKDNDHELSILIDVKISATKVHAMLGYSTSTLSQGQAENVVNTFSTALSSIIEHPTMSIGDLDVLSEHDLDQLRKWNSKLPEAAQECAHHFIHRQVLNQPDSLAVCASDASFTYFEMDELSTKLAHHLQGLGVGPEVVVPLCFEKSAWIIIAMIAVIKAGGAMVTLDPSYPMARLEDILSQVDANLVLASSENSDMWRGRIRVFAVNRASVERLPFHLMAPITEAAPQNTLYIIFTSGSTGKPKGCVIEHSSFLSGAMQHGRKLSMRPGSRILQFASYSFDASILETITALIFGACVCVPDEQARSKGIASMMQEMQITWALLTPSLAKLLQPEDVPGLKTLVLGGEALSRIDIETWAEHCQLINAYGPSECSIVATINPSLNRSTDPANIGYAVGGLLWVVDAQDYNRLVPIGVVGELLVEGPILAREYLCHPEKTAAAFVENPAWMSAVTSRPVKRLYMTGDLVRYNSDGSITFIGRKDTQVKVRGQRIELGEIEHHLSTNDLVQHAVVVLPKSGPFKRRLVAVVSPRAPALSGSRQALQVVNTNKERLSREVECIREYLVGKLPEYMLPATWVIVEAVPFVLSGKMDRAKVTKWLEEMNEEEYSQLPDFDMVEAIESPGVTNGTELLLREVISHALNLPLDKVSLNRSFLNLGGDSISAMQVMTRCKAENMALKIKDILRCKSLSQLALCARVTGKSSISKEEPFNTPFHLSPIQQMYFELKPLGITAGGLTRYNQSFMLRLSRHISSDLMARAVEAVVQRHSMLRARFRLSETGHWTQYVMRDTYQRYTFRAHDTVHRADIASLVSASQAQIDVVNGPVFAVDLFHENKGQLLSLVAHHAVIDLVSWRVIMQDLEEYLESRTMSMSGEKPLPFQTWVGLQAEYSRQHLTPKIALPVDIALSDYDYWGMVGNANQFGDTLRQSFHLDADTTTSLLGPDCHSKFRTEPIDIFLSALVYSFSIVFTNRPTPVVFREGHGREPWNDDIDISGTVGWFTTIFPVHIEAGKTFVETLQRIKDTQRRIPRNGWPYFASRYNNPDGIKAFAGHTMVEIQFDYLGLYQQLERTNALLQQEPWKNEDVGPDVQRFSLFEITAEISRGQFQLTFEYNRHMLHQNLIGQWVIECEQTLKSAVDELSRIEAPQYTLSDFPLVPMSYDGLEKLCNMTLPKLGLSSLDQVEDLYPTSPMQTGLLLSQTKSKSLYQVHIVMEVLPTKAFQWVDINRLRHAWQKVVNHHPILRTVFVESVSQDCFFDQIVLTNVEARISHVKCEKANMSEFLSKQQPIGFQETQPPHTLTICETTTGQVFLKFDVNHALVDGASIPILLHDLSLEYDGDIKKNKPPLYSDYISYLQTCSVDKGLEYWRKYLMGVEPCYFPILDDGVTQEQKQKSLRIQLDSTFQSLNDICKERNITLSNLFQAAWALVLRSYSGSDQVCFGYPVSGRDVPIDGISHAVGVFINMLICRLDMSGTLMQILEQVQEDYSNAQPYQYSSLADVQHSVDLDLSGAPLFNSIVNFHGEDIASSSPTISFKTIQIHDPTEYDIILDVAISEGELQVSLIYRASHLSDGQAQNVASTVRQTLKLMSETTNHSMKISELDLLSELNRRDIWSWNAALPEKVDMCANEIFERQAASRPNALAICSWDGNYSYQQLDTISTRLALHLKHSAGVGPEVVVPLCFERSAWTIVAMLAVIKSGGTFVLLDPSQAINRLKSIVSDLDASLLLASEQHSMLLADVVDVVLVVNADLLNRLSSANCCKSSQESSTPVAKPENALYIVFTSGSTGKPKGCVIEHAAYCTSAAATGKATQIMPTSRVLQSASYSFDLSIYEILNTLLFGGCVCVPSEFSKMNDLVGVINEMKANHVFLTPSVARLFSPSQVPGVETMIIGGEVMSKNDLATWSVAPRFLQAYGPTECTITAAYNTNLLNDPKNIGHSVGCAFWIADPSDYNRLVPIGCVGELLIEGATLARGYLHNAEKTAEVFVKNPKWLEGKRRRLEDGIHRMYKTGDLFRYNSDGSMSFVGRKDTQVKINGQRIELDEIEFQLTSNSSLSGVAHLAVEVCRPAARQCKQTLVAFLDCGNYSTTYREVDNLSLPLTESLERELLALQEVAASCLPPAMIPSVYIPLKFTPMTTGAKLNRKKLRQVAETLSADQLDRYSLSEANKRAPVTEMEEILQSIWSVSLEAAITSIGADDDFFRIGGDSIGAIRMVAAARKVGVLLTVANIFRYPKLSDLATVAEVIVDESQFETDLEPFDLFEGDGSTGDLLDVIAAQCGVERNIIQDVYPCTPLQEGLMALSLKQSGTYIGRSIFRLPSTLNIDRFRDAWDKIAELNPILRTRIVNLEMVGSLQVVMGDSISWWTKGSLKEYLDEDQEISIVYGGLLTRYAILADKMDNLYFVWTLHHALYDGWSQSLILEQVQQMYESGSVPNPLSFNYFINYLANVDPKLSNEFWKSQLAGYAPRSFPQLPSATYLPRARHIQERTIQIARNSHPHITISTIIRAAWAIVVARHSDSEDIIFGATLTGRNAPVPNISHIIGPTITTIPIRISLDYSQTVADFLDAIQNQATNMIPFEHLGLQNINRLGTAASFQSLLVVQPVARSSAEFFGAKAMQTSDANFNTYALIVECSLGANQIDIKMRYDAHVIDQIDRILSQFEQVVHQLNNDAGCTTIKEIDLFTSEDQRQVWKWNEKIPKAVDRCIHELIKEQVEIYPQATAVCAWDTKLTYLELDELSSRLAHLLMRLGIGPEIIVPLCFEKSGWTLVAMLAVMKSGAAFVILDPSHPVKRLEDIIRSTGATLLLSSQSLSNLCTAAVKSVFVVSMDSMNSIGFQSSSPISNVNPRNTAYVIFTSGTTGVPKGCVVEHSSFVSSAIPQAAATKMSHTTRALQYAAYSFDACLHEILTTLIVGGAVCIPPENARMNTDELISVMNEMNINWAVLTPSVARLIPPGRVPQLQTLVLAGEGMSTSDREWSKTVVLINGYGPSECSVSAAFNTDVQTDTDCANIGKPVGGLCWIVEANDHDRLAPIGCIGELLVEGPTLARGYLNEERKTAEVFIDSPAWLRPIRKGSRLYKTGDLARYNADGSIIFIGRKDSQIKLYGQRMEMGDIEHHLSTNHLIENASVVFPKSGLCKNRLVALLSLKGLASLETGNVDIQLIDQEKKDIGSSQLLLIQAQMENQLPSYMVPSVWVLLNGVPLTASGKTDKRKMRSWIEDLDDETYQEIMAFGMQEGHGVATTDMELQIQKIVSRVLNLGIERVPLNRSFLSLGGDSITAMQVMARCRTENITLKIKDILHSKTLTQLALWARSSSNAALTSKEEILDTSFDLSPIQQMYFETSMDGSPEEISRRKGSFHFNQSTLLHLKRATNVKVLAAALEAMVGLHSMLRARFVFANGRWSQQILGNVPGSYLFVDHDVKSQKEIDSAISAGQAALNIKTGPVFAAHHFREQGGRQLLFMVAHHLVIDLVSWRILWQDLEELLESGKLFSKRPFPFQVWCKLQAEYASKNLGPSRVLPFKVATGDYAYWGMSDHANVYGDVLNVGFSLNQDATSKLLHDCHRALRTEPLDVFLSTLIQSFGQTFRDRGTPTVFGEAHGREPWDAEMDLSSTTGWFTTMSPFHIDVKSSSDIIDIVRRTKDARRQVPGNGWPYFTSRFLNAEGIEAFRDHWPMEVVFNYLGLYQQLERDGSLLEQVPRNQSTAAGTADVGRDVRRLALFEISVTINQGVARFDFTYNRHMRAQAAIRRWIQAYEMTILDAVDRLTEMEGEHTLADFPLLDFTYAGLDKLKKERLPQMRLSSFDEIEDVYPCSPMQQGVLISQARSPGNYEIQSTFEVMSRTSETVEVLRLQTAWQKVVARHPSLRTIFIESVSKNGLFDQVVLKNFSPRILHIECSIEDVITTLDRLPPIKYDDAQPPHRLTVCKTSGQAFMKLEISHALVDGGSLSVLMNDIMMAYDNELLTWGKKRFLYSDYVSYLQIIPKDEAREYWKQHLANVEPCYFPSLNDSQYPKRVETVPVDLDITGEALSAFCGSLGVTPAIVLRTAWGLVLRSFTRSDQICFGYLASGRDIPIDGIESAVGAFINMLVCRMDLYRDMPLKKLLEDVQEAYTDGLQHQHTSLADIQHSLGLTDQALFNTAMSFQAESTVKEVQDSSSISLQVVAAHDPSEYDITINIGFRDGQPRIMLGYQTTMFTEGQAANVASTFAKAILSILEMPAGAVGDLNLFSERNRRDVQAWNSADLQPEASKSTVHDLIYKQVQNRPNAQAVCSWDGNLTYLQLDELSTRLAQYLASLGIGPEVKVPVCFEKSKWAVVTIMAVMKSGGVFVLLDPAYSGRFNVVIGKVGAELVLTCSKSSHLFTGLVDKIVTINDDLVAQIPWDFPPLRPAINSRNTAYILFTSGSTGEPKGCIMSHGAYCAGGTAQAPALLMDSNSRVLQFSSYNFDASMMEILTPLIHGACICIPSEHERMNDYAAATRRMGATWAFMTPSFARLLDPSEVTSMKVVVLGGEAVVREDACDWLGKVRLNLCYGPTECTPVTSSVRDLTLETDTRNIGLPFVGNYWIVDPTDHHKLMPVGAIGELLIEGPTLARGYLNSEQQTKAAFIENPGWSRDSGSNSNRRMYKTGDLVQYNADGTLKIIGRKDTQAKLHGQRLEMGEVEHHMRRSLGKGIDVAAEILTLGSKQSDAVLGGFICFEDRFEEGEDLANLTHLTKERLNRAVQLIQSEMSKVAPSYMIPSVFIPLKRLPLTPSLKTDRRKLKQMVSDMSRESLIALSDIGDADQARVAGTETQFTDIEECMRDKWAAVLRIDAQKIGRNDCFLKLGGDSILAIKLVAVCRAEGLVLSVADILRNLSLRSMCERLGSSNTLQEAYKPFLSLGCLSNDRFLEDVVCPQVEATQSDIEDVLDATSMQASFISTGLMKTRGNTNYFVFNFSGPIDALRLENACRILIRHYPILRTVFMVHQGRALQVVLRSYNPGFKHYGCAKWRLSQLAMKLVKADQAEPITLGAPITRFILLDGGKQSLLIMRISHAQYDGMSMPTLVNSLASLYAGKDLPARPAFSNFALAARAANENGAEDYWRTLLRGSSMTNLVLYTKPTYKNTTRGSITRTLPSISLQPYGMTFATVLKAAWSLVLAEVSGRDDVVFGHVVSGRNLSLGENNIDEVLGPCLNLIPVRIQFLSFQSTVFDLLRQVHEQQLSAIPYETFGFDKIVEQCTEWPLWTRFSSVVQHQNLHGVMELLESFKFADSTCKLVAVAPPHDSMDVLVCSTPRGKKIKVSLDFSIKAIPSYFAEELMDMLCSNIELLSTDMHARLPSAWASSAPRIPLVPKDGEAQNLESHKISTRLRGKSSVLRFAGINKSAARLPQDTHLVHNAFTLQPVVERAWNFVMSSGSRVREDRENATQVAFYDIWGSLLPASQFSEYYNREGIDITMEEIIENPTMHLQNLLVLQKQGGKSPSRRRNTKKVPKGPMAIFQTHQVSQVQTQGFEKKSFHKGPRVEGLEVMRDLASEESMFAKWAMASVVRLAC